MSEQSIGERIKSAFKSLEGLGGIFDFDAKRKRLEEINTILQDPEILSNQ